MEMTNATTMSSFQPPAGFASRLPRDDLGPSMRVAVWILASAATVFLTLRLFCKYIRHRCLHLDDWVLIASWLALVGAAVCNTLSIQLGFGKHIYQIPFSAFDSLNTIFLIGQLSMTLQICGHCWSKTSFALTLLMISDGIRGKTRVFIWFAIVSMNILFGTAALLFWIDCTPINKSWQPLTKGKCWDPNVIITYNIFVSAYSGIMDLILAVLPWKIIMSLQMQTKEKIGVGIAMSMGVFAAASAFIKCSSLPELGSRDFPHEGVPLVIWSGTENAVTIMAASVPMLRVLLKSVRPKKRRPRPRPIYETDSSREFMLSITSGKRSFYNKPRKDLATMTGTSTIIDLEG